MSKNSLEKLAATIKARREATLEESYTKRLLAEPIKPAKKVGEEATEVAIAAKGNEHGRLVSESADLLYHLMVLWAAKGIEPADVWRALQAREGRSGIDEKASRKEG